MTSETFSHRHRVLELLASVPRALHAREIASRLGLGESGYFALLGALADLTSDRLVQALPGQRYRGLRAGGVERREGTLAVHPRGFGFVSSAGRSDDVFVPGAALGGAMHGDAVQVLVLGRGSRGAQGRVEAVRERANERVAGVLHRRRSSAWLEPDDPRVRGPIVLEDARGCEDGAAAVVQITRFPETPDENPQARLLESLGPPGDPVVEVRKILARAGVEEPWPEACAEQARALEDRGPIEALDGREDLREVPFVTIDPDDARDHDDAIWVAAVGNGFEVCVAIADVAAFVPAGTPLDAGARARAFSIYLPDRAVPMLPPALSSGLCSLLEGQDRLCLALHVRIDATGRVRSSRLGEAVMRSRAKLTYTGVARALGWSEAPGAARVPEAALAVLEQADRAARVLHRRRVRRGALELDLHEPEIVVDPGTGLPLDVRRRAQDPGVARAYRLVEELMLVANETVARWVLARGLTGVFRVHPPPDAAKLERLGALCDALGIRFEADDASDARRLGAFLARLHDDPRASVVSMLALRSLKRAGYDVANVGHFALALDAYAHFTSPIRRYPDLLLHRQIKRALRGGVRGADEQTLREAVVHCSRVERQVLEVERDVASLYRALLMRSRCGALFEGTVTEVLASALVVTLDAPFVDVIVPADSLGRDRYAPSEDALAMVGERGSERIRLGDRLVVRVEEASLGRRVVLGSRQRAAEQEPRRGRGGAGKRARAGAVARNRPYSRKNTSKRR
jgi:ribonuclease R